MNLLHANANETTIDIVSQIKSLSLSHFITYLQPINFVHVRFKVYEHLHENHQFGVPTRSDTYRSVLSQKVSRSLKFWI